MNHSIFQALDTSTPIPKEQEGCKIKHLKLAVLNGTMVKLTNPSKLHALGLRHSIEFEAAIQSIYEWYISAK
jgi:nucleoside-diphosphate-sugar epimerase